MCLFADRLSTHEMGGNQLRLYFSALAYSLVEALRRLGLQGTEWAEAQGDTIRRKLFKIGAVVRLSVRRIVLQLSSAYPWKDLYARIFHALRCCSPRLAPTTSVPLSSKSAAGGAVLKIDPPNQKSTLASTNTTTPDPGRQRKSPAKARLTSPPAQKSVPVRNAG